jgi:hypothetical protein
LVQAELINQKGKQMKYVASLLQENKLLKEKSLSRIVSKMKEYDCGIITAFRSSYSKKENLERNKKLLANIYYFKFDVITVHGSYIEDYDPDSKIPQQESIEESFFVVDTKNSGKLKKFLTMAGKRFLQDSVFYLPKNKKKAILIGTSPWEGVWPGTGVEREFSKIEFGKPNEFMTKVKNRPFVFLEEIFPCAFSKPTERLGKMAMMTYVDKELKEALNG